MVGRQQDKSALHFRIKLITKSPKVGRTMETENPEITAESGASPSVLSDDSEKSGAAIVSHS